ncbi:barstar family protein [Paenibacillus sp. PR3]|uniref:Barstar family protein n=2 Tax=Paenibacillus terricola TaxID=2763503 RepID=A0ABR8MYW3_9BACL|nr:barstar family protein [Paenibacillus terricola]
MNKTDVRNGVFHLDGNNIVDHSSFYCALGEAINGPGGYFGFNISSLIDCLRGGFGAVTPFTIYWEGPNRLNDSEDLSGFYIDIVEIFKMGDILLLNSNGSQCD